jgi:hypothetical protein
MLGGDGADDELPTLGPLGFSSEYRIIPGILHILALHPSLECVGQHALKPLVETALNTVLLTGGEHDRHIEGERRLRQGDDVSQRGVGRAGPGEL